MSKRNKSVIIYIVLMFLGLGILFYPKFSDWWNTRLANRLMTDYESVIETVDDSEIKMMIEDAEYYNSFLVGNVLPDAFLDEEANAPNASYETILNLTGNGVMATVEIPCIDVNLPVYHYTREDVLEKGVGHLPGSSLPVGGMSTHSVLSAHRGLPSAKLFTDLNLVKEGDLFFIHVLGKTLAYKVVLTKIIEPTDTSDLEIIEGKEYCTLFTCHPYAVNTHRLLVRGERVEYTEEVYEEQQHVAVRTDTSRLLMTILCVIGGIVIAGAVVFFTEFRRRRKAGLVAASEDDDEKTNEKAPETELEEYVEDAVAIDFGDASEIDFDDAVDINFDAEEETTDLSSLFTDDADEDASFIDFGDE